MKRLGEALAATAVVLSGFQIWRLFSSINRYAVDVPFWDQWDFYNAFFAPHGIWEIFSWQHGPHRQGAGFFLTWITNDLTGWNQRAQSFMIGAVMVVAAAAALWLKRRLFGRIQWHDAILVFPIFSLKSWEIYANTPNVSHGALPLLLVLLMGISLTVKNIFFRYGLLLILNFFAIFTGFGVFAGLVTPVLLIIDCWQGFRKNNGWRPVALPACALLCSFACLACFGLNYRFAPAVDCFRFPDPQWTNYPIFIAVELAMVIVPGRAGSVPAIVIGLIAAGMLAYALVKSFRGLLRQDEHYVCHQAVFFLLGFSLLFILNAAFGRVCLGLGAALTSRYVPLILPAAVGAYLFFLSYPRLGRNQTVLLMLFAATVFTAVIPWQEKKSEYFLKQKSSWIQAFRETGNARSADDRCGCKIYPDPERTKLDRKLDWLRSHKYSLFRQ